MFTNNYGEVQMLYRKLDNIEKKLEGNDMKQIDFGNGFARSDLTYEALSVFRNNANERALSPFVEWGGDTVNVYWNEVEHAAEYRITFYKCAHHRVYKMKDFTVGRTDRYLAVDKLVGNGYVIKVFAYDRAGNIIAEARAVNGKGIPYSW